MSPFRGDSGFPIALWGPWCELHWFSKPGVLGAHLSRADCRSPGTQRGTPFPHSPGRNTCLGRLHPIVCCCAQTVSLPFLPSSMRHFYSLLWRAVTWVFTSFSERNNPDAAVDLVCPWEESSSGSSYTASFLLTGLILHLKTMETISWQIWPQYTS